jgi:hypothetical protein
MHMHIQDLDGFICSYCSRKYCFDACRDDDDDDHGDDGDDDGDDGDDDGDDDDDIYAHLCICIYKI